MNERIKELAEQAANGILSYDAESDPQFLADLIRKNGNAVFVTPKEKQVIV